MALGGRRNPRASRLKLERVTWGEIDEMCAKLAEKVKKSGFEPDLIVGIGRGGLVPARLMSDIMGISQMLALCIEFYTGPGETLTVPVVTQGVSRHAIKGKKILVVDDVSDTGESLKMAKGELAAAKEVRIATLHYNPRSKLNPDYYARKTSAWVGYPWEKREIARGLGR